MAWRERLCVSGEWACNAFFFFNCGVVPSKRFAAIVLCTKAHKATGKILHNSCYLPVALLLLFFFVLFFLCSFSYLLMTLYSLIFFLRH